ncbi:MAG: hypothetical protein ACRDQD_16390 [Nocardioidaceae bacterium]
MKRWDGRAITTPRRGTITYGALAANASATGTVNFPTAYGATPDVTIIPSSSRVTIGITSITPSGFTWSASNWSPAAVHPDQTAARWSASL